MKQDFILCPVCGKHKFPAWEDNGTCICPHCGWAHDSLSEEEHFETGSHNDLCLDDYKLRYEYYVEQNPNYHWARDKYPEIPQIEPTDCPVCGKFRFEELRWDDIYCGETPESTWCRECGWYYSPEQAKSPDLKNSVNAMSLNEYKAWYNDKLKENPEYRYFDEVTDSYVPTPHKCPVCGKYEFEDKYCHDICSYCGWEDDGCDEDNEIGANYMSFTDYKIRYNKYISDNSNYKWKKDGCP